MCLPRPGGNNTWQTCRNYGVPVSTNVMGTVDGWPKKYGIGLIFPTDGIYSSFSFFLGFDSDSDNYHFLIRLGSNPWIEVGSYPRS